MKPIGSHNYFIYILTNKNRTVLYIGVTQNIANRLFQHLNNTDHKSFTSRYKTHFLIYYEHFEFIDHAIAREKQLKKWSRKKKEDLIASLNPEWKFLNNEV